VVSADLQSDEEVPESRVRTAFRSATTPSRTRIGASAPARSNACSRNAQESHVPHAVTSGESTTVAARVRNVGGADGTFAVTLVADGGAVATRTVAVGGGESKTVSFEYTSRGEGVHAVSMNGVSAGTVDVTAPTPTPTESPGQHGFGALEAVAALLLVALLSNRRRRER